MISKLRTPLWRPVSRLGGNCLCPSLNISRTAFGCNVRPVTAWYSPPTGDPVLDDVLERIRTALRRSTLQTWVSKVAHISDPKHQVARQLARKGVLRTDEDKILLLFRRRMYQELDPGPERELIASLRQAILADDEDVEPRTAILATMAWRAGLLSPVLDKKERKARKERLEALGRGDPVAGATRSAAHQPVPRRPPCAAPRSP